VSREQLTQDERAAIDAFRAEFPPARLKRLRFRTWQAALHEAWMNDWPEQRGALRMLRNSPRFESTTAILNAYRMGAAA
jgi:hypothetical protein